MAVPIKSEDGNDDYSSADDTDAEYSEYNIINIAASSDSRSDEVLCTINGRINNIRSVQLSNGAMKLLRCASRSLMKRYTQRSRLGQIRRLRSGLIRADDAGGHQSRNNHLSDLYQELQSLYDRIPQHVLNIDSPQPCVIGSALGYLRLLRKEIRDLKASTALPASSTSFDSSKAKVEVTIMEDKLDIKVSCNMKKGLFKNILLALDSIGLIFDVMNAFCNDVFDFQASSTQEGVQHMDVQVIQGVILNVINKDG